MVRRNFNRGVPTSVWWDNRLIDGERYTMTVKREISNEDILRAFKAFGCNQTKTAVSLGRSRDWIVCKLRGDKRLRAKYVKMKNRSRRVLNKKILRESEKHGYHTAITSLVMGHAPKWLSTKLAGDDEFRRQYAKAKEECNDR